MSGFAAEPGGRVTGRGIIAVAAPGLVVSAAYLLWWISDHLLYVGPLDRAAFWWLVVVPVWLSAPVVAGVIWGRLDRHGAVAAALMVGTIVAIAAAILFWQSVAYPACERPVRTPADWIIPSLVTGALIGAGLAVSGFIAAGQFRGGHRLAGALMGGGLEIAMVFLTIFAVFVMFLAGPGCQRPTG